MTSMLGTVIALAVLTYLVKAVGPVTLGRRDLSNRARTLLDALAMALLAGMIASTMMNPLDGRLHHAALLLALVSVSAAWALGYGQVVCVTIGVLTAAGLRLFL